MRRSVRQVEGSKERPGRRRSTLPGAAEEPGEDLDAEKDPLRLRGGIAEANVGRIGPETPSGGDQEALRRAGLEESEKPVFSQTGGGVEEEEGRALRRLEAEDCGRPAAGFDVLLPGGPR